MRYLLDTHILFYYVANHSLLDRNVTAILEDADNMLCVSAETIRELIVAYKNKGFTTKRWKTCEDLIDSIETITVSLSCRWISILCRPILS